ncbi:MAG: radical SAM protein [Bacteroidetes bacterium]|nr:radical SAM protein [Bacteroidota bacterium]
MGKNIGLIDVDSHSNFPNLALMKLSAWHKAKGDNVEFVQPLFGNYDLVYQSKVFTFTPDYKSEINTMNLIQGGSGYGMNNFLIPEIEHICPDYSLYNVSEAYGFLTRGCIRRCEWCIVPKKEGQLRQHADITEFLGDKKAAVLMDNNVLASEWGLKQIEKIINLGIKIDFNQGLDARLIANNPDIAELLSKVKWYKPLRMACDTLEQMQSIAKATELLRHFGTTPSNYFIYVLVKDISDALERVEFLRKLKLDPFAQPYRNFENNTVDKKAVCFSRWVNHKAIFNSVLWENYKDNIKSKSELGGI